MEQIVMKSIQWAQGTGSSKAEGTGSSKVKGTGSSKAEGTGSSRYITAY